VGIRGGADEVSAAACSRISVAFAARPIAATSRTSEAAAAVAVARQPRLPPPAGDVLRVGEDTVGGAQHNADRGCAEGSRDLRRRFVVRRHAEVRVFDVARGVLQRHRAPLPLVVALQVVYLKGEL
jgi:hypothetical protein